MTNPDLQQISYNEQARLGFLCGRNYQKLTAFIFNLSWKATAKFVQYFRWDGKGFVVLCFIVVIS